MIKAIVFDIGGVLINLDMDGCIRAFRRNLGFDRITELLDPCHQKGVYGDMEAGLVSADEFRAEVLRDSRPGSQPEDVDRSMLALLAGMAPDTVETLKALKERYPLYLLSNNNPIAMGHILRMFRDYGIDPETTFREQFISCEMKMLKPSARIYEAVVARIGLPADEILFVDDSETNVEAARKAGLQARTFVPGTKLSALLSEL
ncbi:MAG: HAD family phosphatase [Bacteroidales bacterium]|nr:HAD family phosphatase [Bacteroidales bacterium]